MITPKLPMNILILIGSLLANSCGHPEHHLVFFYFERGDLARAREIEESVLAGLRTIDVLPQICGGALYNMAILYDASGERSKALDALHEAITLRPEMAEEAREDPDFAPLRDDPAFQALVQRDA